MNKLSVILFIIVAMIITISCSDIKRSRGLDYMPDMRDSRAYETHDEHNNLRQHGINYTAMPVPGTIKRGELFPFSISKDKEGDSTNYVASKQVVNPLPKLDEAQTKEAERMYLIHCGICHGTNLDGNGPLYNGGSGPYPAAPKNLVADSIVSVMPEGQIFYSVTYGKGAMGPYGSQLTTSQRWAIVHFVKSKQAASSPGGSTLTNTTEGGSSSSATGTDSSGAKQ